MSMRDHVLAAYGFNLWFAKKAVEDLTDEQMCQQPKPGMNHAAWVLGHLVMERIFLKDLLKIEQGAPEGWEALFTTKSVPMAEVGKYPKKEELIARLDETHALVEKLLSGETFTGVEARRCRRDGADIDISISAAPLHADGSAHG